MIRQLAHICFFTNDLNAMHKFYEEKLGLKIKFTLDNPDGKTFGYYFDCGNSTFIEVFDRNMAASQWGGRSEKSVPGNLFQHLCFEVTGLIEYKSKLEKKGLTVSEISTGMDNSKQAWIADPDGNSIELMEYTCKSLQIQ